MRTSRQPIRTLDRLDRRILTLLQADGRISMKDLAEAVGLTITPCIERVKRLARDGVIMGDDARLNPGLLGSALLVFVEISLGNKSHSASCMSRRGGFLRSSCQMVPRCITNFGSGALAPDR